MTIYGNKVYVVFAVNIGSEDSHIESIWSEYDLGKARADILNKKQEYWYHSIEEWDVLDANKHLAL